VSGGGNDVPTRALVVASRYNEAVTRRLVDGATAALGHGGFAADRVDVEWVPGAFELPLAVRAALESGRYALAVAVGVVIRGETDHYRYVAGEASRGLMDVALHFGAPVGFGLLTCDTLQQALARAGGATGNKGEEAARAALEMWRLLDRFDERAAG
jgi:6,7-dimethyl-8-ribityllumazine synthase